ncbi:hypothetical protein SDC9_212320 [bioreactor metagenome]|uniref:Uncharacterized protein n=1 Tax=bioreactor metagenome TaxID=1076179 RepID=A0A645JLK2_9ZZZZ
MAELGYRVYLERICLRVPDYDGQRKECIDADLPHPVLLIEVLNIGYHVLQLAGRDLCCHSHRHGLPYLLQGRTYVHTVSLALHQKSAQERLVIRLRLTFDRFIDHVVEYAYPFLRRVG